MKFNTITIKIIGLLLAVMINIILTIFFQKENVTIWTFIVPILCLLPLTFLVKFNNNKKTRVKNITSANGKLIGKRVASILSVGIMVYEVGSCLDWW